MIDPETIIAEQLGGPKLAHVVMDHARRILAALRANRIALVELPEPFPITVTEIDMHPEPDPEFDCEPDDRARLVIRFSEATKPGRLFARDALAAALLAAAAEAAK